jgi:hypothetical protein
MKFFKTIFRKKIIIIIHGLANKPPKKLLEKWCRFSIGEGMRTIGEIGTPFSLRLVYWADLLHEKPQDPKEMNKKSETYLGDPYLPGNSREYENFTPSKIKQKLLDKLEKNIDKLFFDEKSFINFDRFADIVLKNLYKDLDCYYHHDCPVTRYRGLPARDAIRSRLADVLRRYRSKEILLIAHSMGTIISYDVLTRDVPDVTISTLITIGSPLAIPVIIKKILLEQGKDVLKDHRPTTPDNILRAWYNYSDLDDSVAIYHELANDYTPSTRGIEPHDFIVYNNYQHDGIRLPHKLYGYLRAPEVARAIYDFCIGGKPSWLVSLSKFFGRNLVK